MDTQRPRRGGTRPTTAPARSSRAQRGAAARRADGAEARAKVVLLSGGNPQIAKADGDAPVQAYIDAMPGWKRDLGRRLDALIVRSVPDVRKAVKWNSPLYGVEGQGWFLGIHTFTRYVKVAFFRGASLRPVPPGASKDEQTRYVDLGEGELDEALMERWVKQAAALPGWSPARPRTAADPAAATRRGSPRSAAEGGDRGSTRGEPATADSVAERIDQRLRELGGWRAATLARVRGLILAADPEITEEWKWRGTPVWSRQGIVCTGEAYAKVVKITFAWGAELSDPSHLFNASLTGRQRRAIDLREGESLDARAFRALVKAALARNASAAKRRRADAGARRR